ncbi:hypothetical protein L1987_72211 [Smallanthus sonchifolius]|uniref:Uncharacterized protein n=1 Tax=Smallanthus sonchifolius TaxID=185202 RepID=A0ACB9AW93_9ASTR|nr:hypothetical protein L1987_72211 [Smallanthus sonchifolius]
MWGCLDRYAVWVYATVMYLYILMHLLCLILSSLEVMEAREERRPVKYFKPPLTQDERLEKREKRKQCNRESARRSRLRKQVEFEELQASVETLTNENNLLRDELNRISGECEKLAYANFSLKGELSKHLGSEKLLGDDDYHLSLASGGNN